MRSMSFLHQLLGYTQQNLIIQKRVAAQLACLLGQMHTIILNINIEANRHTYLEKDMAAHSSILAWKVPRTEEPGRL